jgi:hypothetical protein
MRKNCRKFSAHSGIKEIDHSSYNNSYYNCRGPHDIDRLRELKGGGCKGKVKSNIHPRTSHEGPVG